MQSEDDNTTPSALDDERYMRMALSEARDAANEGEVPVGAVIVRGKAIVGKAHNQTERLLDATAHAEMLAITQAAAALRDWRLDETVMYVTKEPCPMCAGAIVLSRIPRIVFGTPDPARGGAISLFNILDNPALNHRVAISHGVLREECEALLTGFFRNRRAENKSNESHESGPSGISH